MLAAAEIPEEFQDPVAYGDRWLWFALAAIAAVVLYQVVVLWLTRRPRPPAAEPAKRLDVRDEQRVHLARLDALAQEVHAGGLDAREGHQRLSEVLRSYVDAVTPIPARTMALEDLRAAAPRDLVSAVELMYPPEFAPDEEGRAAETFDDALARARQLVSRWGAPRPTPPPFVPPTSAQPQQPLPPPSHPTPPVAPGRGGAPWT